jgi:hypothetical protein
VDIEGWLRGLGLERYAGSFRDNEIDAAVLPRLTDEHLKELGLPLGPRLKLLAAIATLCDGTAPSAPPPRHRHQECRRRPAQHLPPRPSAGNSPSCSATWSARRR